MPLMLRARYACWRVCWLPESSYRQTPESEWRSMPIRRDWVLSPDVDMVLRAQGADPARLRARSSPAVAIAEQALEEGLPLVQPAVAYAFLPVRGLRHDRLLLGSGDLQVSGALVAEHLPAATEVVALVQSDLGWRSELRHASRMTRPLAWPWIR